MAGEIIDGGDQCVTEIVAYQAYYASWQGTAYETRSITMA